MSGVVIVAYQVLDRHNGFAGTGLVNVNCRDLPETRGADSSGELAAGHGAVEHEGNDASGHVLVGAGKSDGLDEEPGLLVDLTPLVRVEDSGRYHFDLSAPLRYPEVLHASATAALGSAASGFTSWPFHADQVRFLDP